MWHEQIFKVQNHFLVELQLWDIPYVMCQKGPHEK